MNLGELRNACLLQARSDAPDVVGNMDLWINMAIRRVCTEQPPFGWWFTERAETIPANAAGNLTLSEVPLEIREVIAGTTRLIKIRSTNAYLFAQAPTTAAYYDIGKTVYLVPSSQPAALYRVVYDVVLPDLQSDSDENTLTVVAPDVVIAGAMVEVSLHLGRVEDAQVWETRFREKLASLQRLNARRRGVAAGDIASDARPS
ncbi:MAG: hypothetical protein NZ902_06515 [Acidilobaceae archaeon]|nr:hypothetical protein [Acidilobaceae archaeon]MDW7974885.1 hypothetical protein [Sulfolobales archaeon]